MLTIRTQTVTIMNWISEGRVSGLENPKPSIHRVRLIKSEAEQSLMRQACRISAEAVKATVAWSKPGMSENELFAKVDFENRVRGASQLAYPPVVAGGDRGNVIHYISNNQVVQDGDMVLMDAGGEVNGYSGDVTRTWPINGRFTSAQKELYEAVLHVQSSIIKTLNEQRLSLDQLYALMGSEFGKVLSELGIIPATHSKEQRYRVVAALCPHHVSHYLGMDVHDTATVPRNAPLMPGTVITVEPGLYVPKNCNLTPSRFHGLAVRIEDDILITETGCDNISDHCPRHPADIETLMIKL